MFKHIMVPLDLRLPDPVPKAMDVAMELARFEGAQLTLVNVTGHHTGETYDGSAAADALASIAQRVQDKLAGRTEGVKVDTVSVHSNDVAAEVDTILAQTVSDIGADLVVVGSHAPRLMDYIFSSHGGYLVRHSKASVFVVR